MIKQLIKDAHQNAVEHGWWDEEKSIGECIALIHSELSEVLEEARKGYGMDELYPECKCTDKEYCDILIIGDKSLMNWDDCNDCKYCKPCGIPVELADTVIRTFDLCGRYEIDLEEAIKIKMEYNKTRPYKHGKKF